tara:strand:- start:635 stop:775 length:141 start_codon:yes stop_codon:yes gene_type:complete
MELKSMSIEIELVKIEEQPTALAVWVEPCQELAVYREPCTVIEVRQ